MYENKKIWVDYCNDYVHVSRIIASWAKQYGSVYSTLFLDWMTELGISRTDREYIYNFAFNGKMELQNHALKFMYDIKKDSTD